MHRGYVGSVDLALVVDREAAVVTGNVHVSTTPVSVVGDPLAGLTRVEACFLVSSDSSVALVSHVRGERLAAEDVHVPVREIIGTHRCHTECNSGVIMRGESLLKQCIAAE